MKVWISKYALTKGVYEAEVTEPNEHDMVTVVSDRWHERTVVVKADWHATRAGAVVKARKMIAARRAGIKREVAKLDALAASLTKE